LTNFNNQLIRNLENAPTKDKLGEPTSATPFSEKEFDALGIPELSRYGNSDNYVVIPFITDTHYASDNYEDKNNARANDKLSLDHLEEFIDFVNKFKVDAVVHGGDLVDGKSTRSNTVKDLRLFIDMLRKAGYTNATSTSPIPLQPVPALIAKGNHDDNVLATAFNTNTVYAKDKGAIYSKLDVKGVVKGSVLDPIFRSGLNDKNKIVFGIDKIKAQPFSTAYKPYMEYDEYLAVRRSTVIDDRKVYTKDVEHLKSMISTVTSDAAGGYNKPWPSTAAKTAFDNLMTLATDANASSTKNEAKAPRLDKVITNTTTRNQVIDMIQTAAKARLRGTYAHVDVKDVRLILLDAYDVPYTTYKATVDKVTYDKLEFPIKDYAGYSAAQVQWFADTLKEAETLGYPVMIFGHHALPGAGFTKDGGPGLLKTDEDGDAYFIGNNELMKAVLDDFVNGSSNTISTLDAIKIYSGQPSGSLPARATLFLNNKESATALTCYDNVKIEGIPYPHTTDSTISAKKAISDEKNVMSAKVTTSFKKQNKVLGVVTGHSHIAKTAVDEVTKKYVHFMSNSSLIDGKAITKGGFDGGEIPRVKGEYTQNSWEVIVIDKNNSQVSIYPVGAMMIDRQKAISTATTSDEKDLLKTYVLNSPQKLVAEGKYPIRRYKFNTTTPTILEYAYLQGDKKKEDKK